MDERWRDERRTLIQVARGKAPADLVLRNARLVNVFSKELEASKEWYDTYDALLKDFQRALGQEATGLKSLITK